MSRRQYLDRAMFHLCLFLAVRFPLTGKTAAFAWKWFLAMCCLSLIMAISTRGVASVRAAGGTPQ